MEEASTDFRVGSAALGERGNRFAVFGCGNSLYAPNYNTTAKRAHGVCVCVCVCVCALESVRMSPPYHCVSGHLSALGAKPVAPLGLGDEDSGKLTEQFKEWSSKASSLNPGELP